MFATIGEALVDLIGQGDGIYRACLGGSVCNFSIALARQGVPVAYLNPLSADRFGRQFFDLLSANQVSIGSRTASACPTSLAIVDVDAQGSPSYAFHRQAVADRDVNAAALVDLFPPALELLHTGGLALVPDDLEKMLAAIQQAKQRGALISIDINLRPMVVTDVMRYTGGVERAIAEAHIVKASDEDLEVLGLNPEHPEEVAARWFGFGPLQLIALTHGARGASLMTRNAKATLAAPSGLALADTVGAGDCFHAGLIAYLRRHDRLGTPDALARLDHATLESALRHAIAAASLNIQRVGCNPATWQETSQFAASLI